MVDSDYGHAQTHLKYEYDPMMLSTHVIIPPTIFNNNSILYFIYNNSILDFNFNNFYLLQRRPASPLFILITWEGLNRKKTDRGKHVVQLQQSPKFITKRRFEKKQLHDCSMSLQVWERLMWKIHALHSVKQRKRQC